MDYDVFGKWSPGSLVPTIQGELAFVPDPLPPDFDRSALFDCYGEAMANLGALNAKIQQLPDPQIIIRPLQKREALASSAMEGTFTTNDELALMDAGADAHVKPETREVFNYSLALSEATDALQSLPISHRLICNAHARLMSNLSSTRGGNKRPGQYKQDQNWIGGTTIQTARFIPPPPKQAQLAMDAFELYINREKPNDIPALIEAAIIHYQFEIIHPFSDGNGRVGRILIPILLLARKTMSTPVFYPSAAMDSKKDEYIDRMFAVSSSGDWTGWLEFFLNICSETSRSSVSIIDRIVELQRRYKQMAMAESRSNNPLVLIDELISYPIISTPIARNKLGVTHRAARQTIALLEKLGIVEKVQGYSMPELFAARDILRATS